MKVYRKTLYTLLFLPLIIAISSNVNAQQPTLKSGKDNFTSFTSAKRYPDIAKVTALTPPQYRNNPDFGIQLKDSVNWYEQIDKRTLKTRTYSGPNNEIIFEKGYDNLNYTDANGWMRAADTKLKPSANGWSAEQQEIPVYLYPDASTALSLGNNALMTFNKNVRFNTQGISVNNYTVGDNGMYVTNAAPNTDKIIRFGRGRVETDYRINKPIKLNGDLIISEDISLPDGYSISENTNYDPETDQPGSLIVTGTDGKMVAKIKSPLCYDSHKSVILGSYHIQKQAGGYRLEVDVPSSWINDSLRRYPVTIDPVVNGRVTIYSGGIIPSCVYPQFDTASIVDTIPGKITITHFWVQGEFFTPTIFIKYGFLSFQTSCISPIIYAGSSVQPPDTDQPGWVYAPLMENDIYPNGATCCFSPSCSTQTFRLTMGIARDTMDTSGCNALYFYYDPSNTDGFPFEAYIVGHTVESPSYTIPTSICASQCSITMADSIHYGVPPYTIIHPWMSDTITTGSYSTNDCTSKAGVKLNLTIPNCPGPKCFASSLKVPPPRIFDACGDSVGTLDSETVIVNAVPTVTGTPDSQSVCSGTPISLSLSSCVAGATFAWTNSEGGSGSGNPITDTVNNNTANTIVLHYSVIATAEGCSGPPNLFPVLVTPFTVIVTPDTALLCEGNSVNITTTGEATSFTWMPASGLNCTTCSNPQATPTVSTTYTVKGNNGSACSAKDSIVVLVGPIPPLSVSKDTTIVLGHSTHLYAITGDSVKITWSPSTGLSSSTGDTVLASPTATTTYTISATDGPCTITAQIVVIVESNFFVPSAFTPNSGNSNSRLFVLPNLVTGLTLQEFRVYNRWGEIMFETSDVNDGWDGTYHGKPQPMGTYVYYVQYLKAGQTMSGIIKGDVTLIR